MPSPSSPASRLDCVDEPLDVVRESGWRLSGVLTTSATHAAPTGCVIMLHGLFSHHSHNFAPALADRIAVHCGVAVYRFNFRGPACGANEPQWTFPGFAGDLEDVEAARIMLENRGLLVVCLIGHSKGANVALMAAAATRIPMLRCVVGLAPRFHMDGMLTALFASDLAKLDVEDSFTWAPRSGGVVTVTRAVAESVRAMDMGAVAEALSASVPVLLVHGTVDSVIPHTDADAIAARSRAPCRVIKLRAGHTLMDARRALLDVVATFVEQHCSVAAAEPVCGASDNGRVAVNAM